MLISELARKMPKADHPNYDKNLVLDTFPEATKIVALENYINEHCSEFLNEIKTDARMALIKGPTLWHGFTYKLPRVFIGSSPNNRHPRGISSLMHQPELDIQLKNAGFTAVRHNSIFCLDTKTGVKEFGKPYKIFPINGYSYTWCENGHTWWSVQQMALNFPKYKFSSSNLLSALGRDTEILISGKYVAVEGNY